MTEPDPKMLATHEQNKREMFDGMRAYQSRIEHQRVALCAIPTRWYARIPSNISRLFCS